jgi:disulfide bond formation protein DsbB
MGGLCCCCRSSDGEETSEMEMKAKKTAKAMAIAKHMSAPTIRVGSESEITGSGLALVGIALEQDHAYWEWHIELPPRVHLDTVLFGVTSKKTNKFYKELADKVQPEEGECRKKRSFLFVWMID